MGIKLTITKKDLKNILDVKTIVPTKDGVTDSVYIINNKYILKIFHNSTKQNLINEIELLKIIKKLKVVKIVKKYHILTIKNQPAILYKKCKGKSLKKVSKKDIIQIGRFLKLFHKITKNKQSTNKNIFKKKYLKKLIKKSNNKFLEKQYKKIDIKLKNDGIIHGDLFIDNAIFKQHNLSCVIDFSQACNGDFIFDLAVVAYSWCKTKQDIKLLIKSYNLAISFKKFTKYIFYAKVYYTTTRYLRDLNYL